MTDATSLVAEFESAHATGVGDPWEMLGRATRALADSANGQWEYGWLNPDTGRMWLDGYEPVSTKLVRVRRQISEWETV